MNSTSTIAIMSVFNQNKDRAESFKESPDRATAQFFADKANKYHAERFGGVPEGYITIQQIIENIHHIG